MIEANREGPYIVRSRFRPEPKLSPDESGLQEVEDCASGAEKSETGSPRVSSEIKFTPAPLESPEELAASLRRLGNLDGLRPQHKTETPDEWFARQSKREKP